MSRWSNIEVSPDDPEITDIDKFEESLGEVPENILKIRELIRRFEVCHFKYKKHLEHIRNSILNLNPDTDPFNIGANHISKGEEAVKNDTTGRSLPGEEYVYSLKNWLEPNSGGNSEYLNDELNRDIKKWLGEKNADKERLVRLLIARLKWDWKSYEELMKEGRNTELEFQVCRMDICHYVFPENLNLLLQGIGEMEPVKKFEGCGSYNQEIENYIKDQLSDLQNYLKLNAGKKNPDQAGRIKLWLTACLAKVLKEQIRSNELLPYLTI